MIVIGAGMSGLLAGQYFRSTHEVEIFERQTTLPNNHAALLRFRSNVVGDVLGLQFKKVRVSKSIIFNKEHLSKSNLKYNNMYSQKTTGSVRTRSISSLDDCDRYIAPENLVDLMSRNLDITFGANVDSGKFLNVSETPIISTMPAQSLAKILEYDLKCDLITKPIWTTTVFLNDDIDVYQTVYFPNSIDDVYRMSITGKRLIIEFCKPALNFDKRSIIDIVDNVFGIQIKDDDFLVFNHHQHHGKLVECQTDEIKKFIGWATQNHNVYSLGRWATHRQILMDDVVNDLHSISRQIKTGGYSK